MVLWQKPLKNHYLQWFFNGFWSPKPLVAMVFQWFPMVANHWSDDGMVTIHRSGLFVFVGVIVQASFSFCVFVFVSILLGLEPTRLLFPARSSHMSLLPAFHSTCSDAVWHLLGISPQIQNTKRITNTNWHLTTNTQENQTHYWTTFWISTLIQPQQSWKEIKRLQT